MRIKYDFIRLKNNKKNQYLAHNHSHCTIKYAKPLVISAGLQSEHLSAAEVE